MAEPFLGEIKMLGFNFAPKDWAFCNGDDLPVSQNQALYSLIGTVFGGDGQTNFKLPDLRGRVPMHRALSGPDRGYADGLESVQLTENEMPRHTHDFNALSIPANKGGGGAGTRLFAVEPDENAYTVSGDLSTMNPDTCSTSGDGLSHENMQPTMVINFVIALKGYYPERH